MRKDYVILCLEQEITSNNYFLPIFQFSHELSLHVSMLFISFTHKNIYLILPSDCFNYNSLFSFHVHICFHSMHKSCLRCGTFLFSITYLFPRPIDTSIIVLRFCLWVRHIWRICRIASGSLWLCRDYVFANMRSLMKHKASKFSTQTVLKCCFRNMPNIQGVQRIMC